MSETPILEGELIAIKLEVRVPKTASAQDVEQWLDYMLGYRADITMKNALLDCELTPFGREGLRFERTGEIGERVEFGHEKMPDGSTHYKVRYSRKPIA